MNEPISLRDVHAQTFVGRDINLNITHAYSGSELNDLLDQVLTLLRRDDVQVQNRVILTPDRELAVEPAQTEALQKFIGAASSVDETRRVENYLAHLCLRPHFQTWHQRFVPLSGGYRKATGSGQRGYNPGAALLDPQFSKILVRGEGPQREIERVHLEDIRTAVDEHPSLILLAAPGAGKTTVLQRLTLDVALKRLQSDGERLPLYVPLANQKPTETPTEFLARRWCEEMPGTTSADFINALRQGQLCILCDALNEARRENYQGRLDDWRDFARDLPAGNRLIFSCRTLDYNGALRVQQVEVDPLDDDQIIDFGHRYLNQTDGSDAGDRFWQSLSQEHGTLLSLARTPYYLNMLVELFRSEGNLPDHRATLFERFALQLLQREEEKRHPDWIQASAQHLALSTLAFAMQERGDGTELTYDEADAILPAQVTVGDELISTPSTTIRRLGHSATLLSLTPTTSETPGKVKFSHHLLQEYFAAEALLRRLMSTNQPDAEPLDLNNLWWVPTALANMPDAPRGEWDPLPLPPTTGWEQTTIVAAGLYPELIERVRPINPALAARCFTELHGSALRCNVPQEIVLDDAAQTTRQTLQLDLLAHMGFAKQEKGKSSEWIADYVIPTIHLRSRMEAGLLLGQLGDPRFAIEEVNGVRVILPSLVPIDPAGATIGSGDEDPAARSNERPHHQVDLAPYAIGRYPVTNAEYACFMAAGGYDNEQFWTEGGRYWLRGEPVPGEDDPAQWWIDTWQRRRENPQEVDELVKQGLMSERDADNWRNYITWSEEAWRNAVDQLFPQGQVFREPRYWQDETFNNPSQPVVGVTWYEAVAYANWLAHVTEQPFRLPSEPEWAWAARRRGEIYPWGNKWDPERTNSLEGRVMRTTPVGSYPHGATSDGIYDLSGNVYEWTSTLNYTYPWRAEDDRENLNANGLRIMRGGGWPANQQMVRCGFRSGHLPGYRDFNSGFRLARGFSL